MSSLASRPVIEINHAACAEFAAELGCWQIFRDGIRGFDRDLVPGVVDMLVKFT